MIPSKPSVLIKSSAAILGGKKSEIKRNYQKMTIFCADFKCNILFYLLIIIKCKMIKNFSKIQGTSK